MRSVSWVVRGGYQPATSPDARRAPHHPTQTSREAPMANHGTTVEARPDRATATITTGEVDPYPTGRRAAEILDAVEAHPLFERLRTSTLAYPTCWATFTGYPLISEWDIDTDG